MSDENTQKIEAIYEQLLSTFHGLGEPDATQTTVDGPLSQYAEAISKLQSLTGQQLDGFLPSTWKIHRAGATSATNTRDLKAQLSGLLGWLRANYLSGKDAHYVQASVPSTSVNQTVNQDVNVMQSVTLDISDLLTLKQTKYKEDTKERGFIDKVKSGLRGIKDTASLLALITKTASEFGLSVDELQKLLS